MCVWYTSIYIYTLFIAYFSVMSASEISSYSSYELYVVDIIISILQTKLDNMYSMCTILNIQS